MGFGNGKLDQEDIEQTAKIVTGFCLIVPKIISLIKDFINEVQPNNTTN